MRGSFDGNEDVRTWKDSGYEYVVTWELGDIKKKYEFLKMKIWGF